MMRTAPIVLIVVTVLFTSIPLGCQQGRYLTLEHDSSGSVAGEVSVDALAADLDLELVESTRVHATMVDGSNRIFLIADPDGQAFVNHRPVGPRGGIAPQGETLFLSKEIVSAIRSALRRDRLAAAPVAPQRSHSLAGRTVVIDAGHGGRDPGATSVLGTAEKHINLAVALELGRLLRERGVGVVFTRDDDVFVELDDRVAIGNRAAPDLFVSIHADSCLNPSARGFTIYTSRSPSAATSRAATDLEKALSNSPLTSRSVRQAGFRVVVKTRCPAVLVELGFLSNREEAALLVDSAFQNMLARLLCRGIVDFLSAPTALTEAPDNPLKTDRVSR